MGSRRGFRSGLILALATAAVTLATPAVNVRPYSAGFASPTYIASNRAEPNRLYVVEQPGRIRYLVRGRVAGTFLDIRSRVASGGERGLLSVAFSPTYARDHRFYVDYTDLNGDTRVVEFRSRKGRAVLSTARQLLFVKQPYPNHNGGQLQFGPDGLLYVGMGDGGSGGDPENRAQNLSVHLGKLLRTNPFIRRPRWTIAGYGLRNPWRFSFDSASGDLYIADVGQGAWEEIDFRTRGQLRALANYGWNIFEGRARYRNAPTTASGELVAPIYVYSHSEGCSITGGYVYRGKSVPAAVGRYIFGDYCSGTIWSLRIENGRAVDVRRESAHVDSLTTFGVDARNELYAASANGRVFRLTP
jgi:glucose/arabinose dehydrogenase